MKKLGFGFMRLPLLDEKDHSSIDIEKTKKLVDEFMKRGFNYFDTGYGYHGQKSEDAFRKAVVERYPRDSFFIADKMPTIRVTGSADYPVLFEEQLKRCGVEYFDYYLLHNIWSKSYRESVEYGGFDFIQKKISEGRIKRFGFSFHDKPELLEKVLSEQKNIDFVQLQLNYIDWESPTVQSRACLEICQKYNKPVTVMEPNKAGSLINLPKEAEELLRARNGKMSNAAWAMSFAASQKNVTMVLSGMNELEQVIENTDIIDNLKELNAEDLEIIKRAADIVNKNVAIPCTKCRYCTEKCPKSIPIPEYFAAFNTLHMTNNLGNAGMYYRRYAAYSLLASECLKCGKCIPSCPQHLDIPALLKKTADAFENK